MNCKNNICLKNNNVWEQIHQKLDKAINNVEKQTEWCESQVNSEPGSIGDVTSKVLITYNKLRSTCYIICGISIFTTIVCLFFMLL